MTWRTQLLWIGLFTLSWASRLHAQPVDSQLRHDVIHTIKKAASFYRTKVASHGGYVYYYSLDLKERWGEGRASPDTIFVQPPGTPTVGMAFLKAYEATGDKQFLDAARETAEALVYGQLQSGGWTQTIHFGPAKRLGKYRNGKGGSWNVSSLDDGQTQAALQMVVLADQALGLKHGAIHDAAGHGLKALLLAQFANGGFPQVWTGPVDAKPILQAKFPNYDWKTEGKIRNYWDCYTLNDNLAGTVAATLMTAHRVYKDDKYKAALAKFGDFLILAQMPEPQPGWCQQYNFDMAPIWARKFEPPAITGWESQDVMDTLIAIARFTGSKKYLEPIPRALAYFQKSVLENGKVARYYEFKTNKPLYMDARYQLTYDDAAAPSHYGWQQPARLQEIAEKLDNARKGVETSSRKPTTAEVRKIVQELDLEGRWISTYDGEQLVGQPRFDRGYRFIASEVFSRNVSTLCDWLTAANQ
jgi:PelA/Pel-15E family pectate lyase